MPALTKADWDEQLMYQATWVRDALYPGCSLVNWKGRVLCGDIGWTVFDARLDGILFKDPESQLFGERTWEQVVNYCNSVVPA